MLTRSSVRTSGTSDFCTYLGCYKEGAGELRGHYFRQQNNGIPWTMCIVHIERDKHPKDLHDKLVRW